MSVPPSPRAAGAALRRALTLLPRWYGRSLSHRLMAAMAALAVMIGLLLGTLSYVVTEQLVMDSIVGSLESEAQLARQRTEAGFADLTGDLDKLARNSLVSNAIADSQGREAYLIPFLKEQWDSREGVEALSLLDFEGRIVASARSRRHMPWPAEMLAPLTTRQPVAILEPASENPALLLAFPVVFGPTQTVEGVLAARIDISTIAAPWIAPMSTGYLTRLVGRDGVRMAAAGTHADGEAITARTGLQFSSEIDNLGIELVTTRSRAEAFERLAMMKKWYLLIAALVVVGGLATARAIARRITQPITELSDFAAQVAAQPDADWGRPRIPGRDEVARMGRAFERMLGALDGARRHLERRVADRTREVEETRDRLEGILGSLHDIVYSVTPDLQRVLYVNAAGERALGLPAATITATPGLWLEQVHEDDRPGLLAAFAAAHESGSGSHGYRLVGPGGVLCHIEDRFTVVRSAHGETERIEGVATDITARVYAEEAREMAEAMLRLKDRALESSSNGVTISDMRLPDQPLVYVNRGFETMTGYEANEVYGLNCRFLQGADRTQPAVAELSQAIAELRPCTVVLRNYRKDGTAFWNELSVSPVLDADGRATHYVGVQTDITARMLAEARAEERARRLDSIFALSPDGFVSFDAGGRVAHVNPAFTRMTGIESGAVLRRTREDFDALFRAIADPSQHYPTITGEELAANQCTVTIVSPERRILERSARGGSGGDGATVLYFRDVTRETEVDRMKSEFLSTAAHELRTPMASIRGFSELLLRRQYDEATRRDLVETILKQSVRLTGLLNELLDLARIEARGGKDFRLRVQPLAKIVEDTIGSMLVHGDSRKVEVRMPERPVLVNVDADKLQQALTNVVSNAYKYSPAGGAIELEVKVVEGDSPEAVVSVRDHGIGLTPEQLARCFERFFRADTSGNIPGTGLGLALVKEIVELHGGRAEMSSVYGEGTRVTMRLPLARSEGAALAA